MTAAPLSSVPSAERRELEPVPDRTHSAVTSRIKRSFDLFVSAATLALLAPLLAAIAFVIRRTSPGPSDDSTAVAVVRVMPSRRQWGWRRSAKRAMDIAGASASLVVLSPVLAVVSVAVKVDSRGPVIFRQKRVGYRGELFTVLKFRSMHLDADPEVHRQFLESQSTEAARLTHFKVQGDGRITRCGQVIRRLSIDELPQLVNVLKGEMSLVGPRPDVPYSLDQYLPQHYRRFGVLPGLTGLWQVSGRSALSYQEMLDLDVEYADRWTLRGDVELLMRTVPELLRLGRAG